MPRLLISCAQSFVRKHQLNDSAVRTTLTWELHLKQLDGESQPFQGWALGGVPSEFKKPASLPAC
jgi:hypothetical protein